jgi:hypothetical protein
VLELLLQVTIDDTSVRDVKIHQMELLVGTLMHLPFRVTRAEDIETVAGVGPSSLAKVAAILRTGSLKLTQDCLAREDVRVQLEFCKVRAAHQGRPP